MKKVIVKRLFLSAAICQPMNHYIGKYMNFLKELGVKVHRKITADCTRKLSCVKGSSSYVGVRGN